MKILMVNKFLYPNGGSETYIFELGKALAAKGHEVWYFGMDDPRNIVGNPLSAYTENMDFRNGGGLSKLAYPFKIIYSIDAKKQIRRVLESFQPDVVHLNNINYQLTPAILYEIKKKRIPVIWTAHDYQLICPNHMLYIPGEQAVCTQCLGGTFRHCAKNKCIHGSTVQSIIGMLEARLYRSLHTYKLADKVICPSYFMEKQLSANPDLKGKTTVLHNFITPVPQRPAEKQDYAVYFGRYDREKGIQTLLEVCRSLPDISFIFAGSGELEAEIAQVPNIQNRGFLSGDALYTLIRNARFSIYPSEWFENCPFSIMESQMLGTPVIGADMGGIPELIQEHVTGLLFESGNKTSLQETIQYLWDNKSVTDKMSENCNGIQFDTLDTYCKKLLQLYEEISHAR